MTKIFIPILVLFVSLPLAAQKVPVQVAKTKTASGSEWQILDAESLPVIAGNEFPGEDSVAFALDVNKRYYIEVSIAAAYKPDVILFHLYINSEPVLLISDLPPGDHFFTFFTGVRQRQAKITGGTNTSIAEFPWQVFFESGSYTCGGSIISGDWIITAAHCTEDDFGNLIPASQMDIIVGADDPRSGLEGKKYFVSRVIRHEQYDPSTLNNDIALLQLTQAINYPNATPIRLVSKIDSAAGATDPGVMSWISGYGLTMVSTQTIPAVLQKVQLPLITNAQASTVWTDIPATDIMAGFKDGNKDACNGDSGGPLVVPVDSVFKLAGLVSWGSSDCNTYGAYTRISLFESWINSKTGIEISYVPPVPAGDSIVCKGVTTSTYNVGSIADATDYQWQLLPAAAGTVLGNSGQATVTWDQGYTGAATVRLRVTKFNIVSYWSALTVHIAEYNSLISGSNDTTLCAGQPVTLKVESKGYNLNYAWLKNDNPIQSGTSPKLVMLTTNIKSDGIYRCDISGSCGNVISQETDLTILPETVIQKITPDTVAVSGGNITLKVYADGHNLLYQWSQDENHITGANDPVYSIENVNASSTGLYMVDVSGTCGEEISKNVYVYITNENNHAEPEIFVWPTLVTGDFNVALSNDQNYNLLLFSSSGVLIKDQHNCRYKTTLNISDLSRGIYIITVYGDSFRKSVKLVKN